MNPEEIILINKMIEGHEINPYVTFSVLFVLISSLLLCLRDSQ